MEQSFSLRANIPKLYWLEALYGMLFALPIIVLFYEENGLSLGDIFLLEGLYALTATILEIPSGYLSDRWGRKRTLVIGAFTGFLSIVTYSLSTGFFGFLLAEILIAVMTSFYSGTIEALTYDTLLEMRETDRFRRITGHQSATRFLCEAAASIIGGLLALHFLRLPVIAVLFPYGIACLVALTLEEPSRHKLQEQKHLSTLWRITKNSLGRNRALRGIMLIHSLLSMLAMSVFWFTQPYQSIIGLPLWLFGAAHAAVVATGALAASSIHRFEKWMDDRFLLIGIAFIVILSMIALGSITALWGLLFLFGTRAAWGLLSPLTADLVNRMTTSDIRATVLSIRSFGFRLLFALLAPLIGYGADVIGFQEVLILESIAGVIALGVVFLWIRPVWREVPA